jgi:hypothetical protein
MVRASLLALFVLFLPVAQALPDQGAARRWQALREDGRVAIVRHTRAPGTGDPSGYPLDDCKTQRNLSDEGREQARKLGDRFRAENINVTRVLTSQWCRCWQTAELMDLGPVEEAPTLNNAHMLRHKRDELAAGGREVIAAWDGPGILLVSTHGANVLAMLGIHPREGEVVVVEPDPSDQDKIRIVARIPPSS